MENLTPVNKIDFDQFDADVSISIADLSSAMASQAALAGHYGRIASEATYQHSVFKIRRNAIESKVVAELREKYESAGTKISETRLNTEVQSDSRFVAAQRDYYKAGSYEELAKNAFDAIRQRRDMLIQLGASDREDRKGELWMRGREEADNQRNPDQQRVA